ncbi:MAG TPA: isocitrate lyase/phosphoenolpyruvate mutase family protein [Rubrivivax sp.]|nr:isocitrate lyase/phosphoenolpyruvate mutase family protein [Rubrivivax sp.]HRZ61193.1 isocitrate lyase/phosphoenolpyruvate mutase family protein [Rubrivivax sp.]
MDRQAQVQQAERFRALHDRSRLLLLPNAWDAGSARVFADLGFDAIATTSGGVAWSLGHADGETAPLAEVIDAIRRIVRVTPLPVSADFEGGYGDTPAAVAANVRAVISAGVAGINLEDGIRHDTLRAVGEAADRIAAARAAAREAGVPIVINARIDAWIIGGGASETERIDEALRRAQAYLAAGADCIYPIALARPDTIAELCTAIPAPVNIGARPGLPDLAALAALGVARVSTATRLAAVALSAARTAAQQLRDSGRFDALDSPFGYPQLQRLFGAA